MCVLTDGPEKAMCVTTYTKHSQSLKEKWIVQTLTGKIRIKTGCTQNAYDSLTGK